MATLSELSDATSHINIFGGNPNAWRQGLSLADQRTITELLNSPKSAWGVPGTVKDTVIGALRSQHPNLFSPTGQLLYPWQGRPPAAPAPDPTGPAGAGDKPSITDPSLTPPAGQKPSITDPGLTPPATPPAGAGDSAGADQDGKAIEAVKRLEAALKNQTSKTAQADRALATAVLQAHSATVAGKQKLVALQQSIEEAVTRQTALDTPMGAAEFQRFLLSKHREILDVVTEADLDSASKRQIVAGLADLYGAPAENNPGTGDTPQDPPPAAPPGGDGTAAAPPTPEVPGDPPAGPPDLPGGSDEDLLASLLGGGDGAGLPGTPGGLPPADSGLLGGLNPAALGAAMPQMPQIPMPTMPTIPGLGGAGLGGLPGMFGGAPAPASSGLSDLLKPKDNPAEPEPSIKSLLDEPGTGGQQPTPEHPGPQTDNPGSLLDQPNQPSQDHPTPGGEHPTNNNEEPAPTPGAPVPASLAPPAPPATGPTEVHLPNGQTLTAPNPQLANVSKAIAEGTPIADAFRQNNMTIPPPGAAVPNPTDPSRITMGYIGQFSDHQVYALSKDLVVLNGQIRPIAEASAPGFLGWMPPPEVPTAPVTPTTTTTTAAVPPAPSAPAGTAAAPAATPATGMGNNLLTPQHR